MQTTALRGTLINPEGNSVDEILQLNVKTTLCDLNVIYMICRYISTCKNGENIL